MDPDISFPEGWTAPLELTGALPRETSLSDEGSTTAMVATVLILVAVAAAIWAGIHAVKQMAHTAALRREGLQAAGQVTKLRAGRSSTPWDSKSGWWVSYGFTANGIALTGESRVPSRLLDSLRLLGPLPIRFLPSNPAINHPAAWEESALSSWAWLAVAAVPAAFGILLLAPFRGQRQLVIEGVPTAGVITKCSSGSRGVWSVEYQFRPAYGSVVKGHTGDTSRLEAGATICVLYLPKNPRLNQSYPVRYYRVAQ